VRKRLEGWREKNDREALEIGSSELSGVKSGCSPGLALRLIRDPLANPRREDLGRENR
jgi:hypothetical protein